ncbi:MAG: excinuclease ABC subunit UvrC [Desulfitobacteriaceae bacterium]|nr:excinuclease ABC subunit UvrC [Desulfitobacteriaceae bacterium]
MDLETKLSLLPNKPGVYLMKDERGKIIYVGKATSLRQRVRSYFQNSRHHTPKENSLVKRIADLETIVVDSPVEALILEGNLIKQYRPRYNVRLKDDKHYPYLKITLDEEYPRVLVVRSTHPDGAKYFGPYTSSSAMNETLKVIRGVFPVRSCKDRDLKQKKRPCLNAHINKCTGPCTGNISKEEYGETVRQLILFLEGRQQEIIKDLEKRMQDAAEELRFEEAARIRDRINAVKQVVEKQKVENDSFDDRDVIALATEGNEAVVQVFFVRQGKIVGRDHFFLTNAEGDRKELLLSVFLHQHYSRMDYIPPEIVVEHEPEDLDLLVQWLSNKRHKKVSVHVPRRGDKKRLVELVAKNARILLDQHRLAQNRRSEEAAQALEELRQELKMPRTPQRIECYDISNIQGTNSVGSMVVFINGEPKPSQYRRFKIKTVEGPNDFASLQEVVSRRVKRGQEERVQVREARLDSKDVKFAEFPDLMIIDGGKGQLSAVKEVLDELGVDIPVFGLAKEFEHLFRPGESSPVILTKNSPAFYLVQRVRDEAHRFAITYHRKLRGKEQVKSLIDDIPGIGPARKKALMNAFGSLPRLAEADLEEIVMVEGMNRKAAEAVFNFLQEHKK